MSAGDNLSIIIKWAGKEYPIENIPLSNTVLDLKNAIHVKTSVLPARQKLLNLRFKGKAPTEDQSLSSLSKFSKTIKYTLGQNSVFFPQKITL